MKNRLILIDWDGVIFKTDLFNTQIFNILSDKFGIEYLDIYDTYEVSKTKKGFYDLFEHLKLLRIKKSLFNEIEEEIILKLTNDNFVFLDAKKFISQVINSEEDNLVIFSQGADRFHKMRLKIAGISDEINSIVTKHNKLDFLKSNIVFKGENIVFLRDSCSYQRIYFIVDNPDDKYSLNKIDLYRVRRLSEKYSEKDTPSGFIEVGSLDEIRLN